MVPQATCCLWVERSSVFMLQDQSILWVVEWNCSTNVACNCCMLQSRIVYGGLYSTIYDHSFAVADLYHLCMITLGCVQRAGCEKPDYMQHLFVLMRVMFPLKAHCMTKVNVSLNGLLLYSSNLDKLKHPAWFLVSSPDGHASRSKGVVVWGRDYMVSMWAYMYVANWS